jgi:hypothetical protein
MGAIILGWLTVAALVLVGCTDLTRSGAIHAAAAPADQCEKYRGDPTTFARCQLFTSPLGANLIPAVGRSAGLEAQLQCAKFRRSLEQYEACLGIEPSPAEPEISAPRDEWPRTDTALTIEQDCVDACSHVNARAAPSLDSPPVESVPSRRGTS